VESLEERLNYAVTVAGLLNPLGMPCSRKWQGTALVPFNEGNQRL